MPICLNGGSLSHDLVKRTHGNDWTPQVEFRESSPKCLEIGLINNMPDGALQSTERQFLTLLDSAADGVVVRLSFFALPDVPRSDSGWRHIRSIYSDIDNLWNRSLDGLIVTGTEPRSVNLMDEPYWESMTRVIEWAEHNTHSTVWSCLAAHAAVLHSDRIARRLLSEKRFGLFECAPVSDHQLTADMPSRLMMPHSRWNDLPEEELLAHGYEILTRSKDGGVDAFVKQKKSMFVFFQGHPEYEANTLLLEYRRDINRYLQRKRDKYPQIPAGYFDRHALEALAALKERVLCERRGERPVEFPTALAERNLANTWRFAATRIYGNWLTYLSVQKERRLQQCQGRKTFAGEREVSLPLRAAVGG